MREPVKVLLVAIGGYGENYVRGLLDHTPADTYSIEGVVDPLAREAKAFDRLQKLGVPIYDTLEELYAKHEADLAFISSPIHYHAPQTCGALAHGTHVLVEKPIAGTIQEARQMIRARDAAGRFVSVGYNWSFSREIQALKADIMTGRYGRPRRLKCLGLGARDESYYHRNNWAGAARAADGRWVLDSPLNNAYSHYLHNMFYLLGDATDRSAMPVRVVAELYRANDITNFDTGLLRAWTGDDVEVLFYTSHAVQERNLLRFVFEFDEATITWQSGQDICARFVSGEKKRYSVDQGWEKLMTKLWDALDSVRTGKPPVCGLEAASAQTLAMNGAHESVPEIVEFPQEMVRVSGEEGKRVTWVEGLAEALVKAYENWALPSEMGVPWAYAGSLVDLRDYDHFPRALGS